MGHDSSTKTENDKVQSMGDLGMGIFAKPVLVLAAASATMTILSGADFVSVATAMNGGLGVAVGFYVGNYANESVGGFIGAAAVPALIGGQVDMVLLGGVLAAGAVFNLWKGN